MRSSNPALRIGAVVVPDAAGDDGVMTMRGLAARCAVLFAIVVLACAFTWKRALGDALTAEAYATAGLGIAMVFSVVTWLRREWAPLTAPVVAMCIGLFVGGASSYVEREVGVAAGVAMLATAFLFPIVTWVHLAGLVAPDDRVRVWLNSFTGGFFALFALSVVLPTLGVDSPVLVDAGVAGIALAGFLVSVAALSFTLDYEAVRAIERSGAPRWMEWYCGFALLVTLIWMYPELVRLLAWLHARVRRGGEPSPT